MRSPSRRAFLAVQLLTLCRVPLAAAFALVLLIGGLETVWILIGLGLLAVIELSDILDGVLARRVGVASEWGAMLDPLADSLSRLIIYWALACTGLILPLVPLVMALRDVLVAYARVVLARTGGRVAARLSGKIKAWTQGLGAIATLVAISATSGGEVRPTEGVLLIISLIVVVVTAWSAVAYVAAAWSAVRRTSETRRRGP